MPASDLDDAIAIFSPGEGLEPAVVFHRDSPAELIDLAPDAIDLCGLVINIA
jgi:hypothetical protein